MYALDRGLDPRTSSPAQRASMNCVAACHGCRRPCFRSGSRILKQPVSSPERPRLRIQPSSNINSRRPEANSGPIVEAFGVWGQRRIEADLSLQHLDVQLLMWDMRRNLNTTPMPRRRNVVQFVYPELPAAQRSWWPIVDPQKESISVRSTPASMSSFTCPSTCAP